MRPWFCAVSFINPHDLSAFPYAYNLTNSDPTHFGSPTKSVVGYIPPPTGAWTGPAGVDESIPALPNLFSSPSNLPVGPNGQSWNVSDSPATQPYGTGPVYGKPTLQWDYQNNSGAEVGTVKPVPNDWTGWCDFLNYYYWTQATVDAQIGRITQALSSSSFANNTVVIFLSDHGDYAGSHSIHGKAFGLYHETLNVPLYIQFPNQTAKPVTQVCSSVDILPFIYSYALGNSSWRSNPTDLVAYLHNREAITDFVFGANKQQRRVTNIAGVQLPYVLHTTDEGFSPFLDPQSGSPIPGHAVGFRTVNTSTNPYGGGHAPVA